MSDVLKFLREAEVGSSGFLLTLADWSEAWAQARAQALGVGLTEAHWDVIRFLRAYYREFGAVPGVRQLAGVLAERYAISGGRRYLYQLFPGGPVMQACELAGLPRPAGATDPGFGVAE